MEFDPFIDFFSSPTSLPRQKKKEKGKKDKISNKNSVFPKKMFFFYMLRISSIRCFLMLLPTSTEKKPYLPMGLSRARD